MDSTTKLVARVPDKFIVLTIDIIGLFKKNRQKAFSDI